MSPSIRLKPSTSFKHSSEKEDITVLTPEEVARLLSFTDDETRPLYAIAAFAGVRWGEIERLEWKDIHDNEIVVTAGKAKTRSRRIVDIQPNLKTFLAPYQGKRGSVLPVATEQETKGTAEPEAVRAFANENREGSRSSPLEEQLP